MNIDFILIFFSSLVFILFLIITFSEIKRKGDLSKFLFFISLFFASISFIFTSYYFIISDSENILMITFSILLTIMSFLYLVACLVDFSFIKLRLFFTPYFFLILIITNFFLFYDFEIYSFNLFGNKTLALHIILSLLAYSFLSISAFSSLSIFAIEKKLKAPVQKYNTIYNLLPSIYESEIITIKLLCTTQIFLLLSLITGFSYSYKLLNNYSFFLDEKSIFSVITFILICGLLFIRYCYGISGKKVFNIVFLSYFFINFSYFGIKVFW